MDNKKRYLPLIAIVTLVFALLSTFMLYSIYQDTTDDNYLNIFNREDSYIKDLEEALKMDITADKPLDVLKEIGCEGLIIPTKYDKYFTPCFEFIITSEGAKITTALAKEFYDYDLAIGDVITHVDNQALNELAYFKVFEYLYAKEYCTKSFTLSDGRTIDFKYEVYHNRCEVSEEDNVLTIKLYSLNVTTQNYVYKLATAKEYDQVILDMSQATISSYNTFCQYLSLFANEKAVLFQKPEGVKALIMHKLENARIIVGDNQDPGILFFTTCINRLNNKVSIDKTLGKENYFNAMIYTNSDYKVYLFNYELVALASSGVVV